MSIKESIAERVVNARQWFSAFTGPCLYLAGFALLAGFGGGYWFTHSIWDAGALARAETRVAIAEKNLSDFKGEIAAQSSTIRGGLIKDMQANADALRARDQAITAAIDGIPARINAALDGKFKSLGSLLNAPQYDCVRTTVLPAEFLRALEQPPGNALSNGSIRENEVR